MKGLYSRLVLASTIYILVFLLTGLGIVLGQFFPIFNNNADPQLARSFLIYLFVILGITLFVSFFIITRLLAQYIKPIDEASILAIKLVREHRSIAYNNSRSGPPKKSFFGGRNNWSDDETNLKRTRNGKRATQYINWKYGKWPFNVRSRRRAQSC